MSFLKRKDKNVIPPVQSELSPGGARGSTRSTSSLPSYKSSASTYVASRDGPDPYNTMSTRTLSQASYNKAPAGQTVDPQADQTRNELFAGYNPQGKAGSGRYFDGPALGREPAPGEENDEDVEGIKQQTRFLKQDGVNSTRNALRLAREAEETAGNTIARLGDQSGKL